MRVLVCDDDPGIRDLLGVTLEDDFEVVFAANGREGLEAVRDDPSIAGIVLDVMMPEMDGFEVLRRIRTDESTRDTAVVMLTARVWEPEHVHGAGGGADAYLDKPFDPETLLDTLREVLGRPPQERTRIREAKAAKVARLRELEQRLE